MENKKRIILSVIISAFFTAVIGLAIIQTPEWFFPANFKITMVLISFFSIALSSYVLLLYGHMFRKSIVEDERLGRKKSNLFIAFFFVIVIWSILFGLLVYDSPQRLLQYLIEYGPALPIGIIFWYVIISIIRKEHSTAVTKPLENQKPIFETTSKKESKIEGAIIAEGGYPAHGYDLIFTETQLIVVDTGATLGNLHLRKFDEKAMNYQNLSPEQILSSFNCKWTYYTDVKKAELKKYMMGFYYFNIETSTFSEKYLFKKNQYQKAENLFNKFLYLKGS